MPAVGKAEITPLLSLNHSKRAPVKLKNRNERDQNQSQDRWVFRKTEIQHRNFFHCATIGYSTRTLDDFISLLKTHSAIRTVDVRTVPRSRHNPQFNRDSLPIELEKVELGYV